MILSYLHTLLTLLCIIFAVRLSSPPYPVLSVSPVLPVLPVLPLYASTMSFVFSNPIRLAALLACTLTPLYFVSYEYQTRNQPSPGHASGNWTFHKLRHDSLGADDFAEKWVQVHVDGPFNIIPIRDTYGNQKTWRSNPILNLDDADGGIRNIRGNILDFLFQAITTSGSTVLPAFFHVSQAVRINSTYGWAQMLTLNNTHTAIHDGPQQPRQPPRDAGTLLRLPQHHARWLPTDGDPALQRRPAASQRHLRPHRHMRRPAPRRCLRAGPACWTSGAPSAASTRPPKSPSTLHYPWEFDLMTEAYQLRRPLGRVL